jgi:hypothetical protein
MPLILADRVRDTTTTTGTGTVTLSGTAPTGYQNFSVIGNGNTTYYTINAGSQWEVGIGTYSSTGPTLARNTVLESSNANALVDFAAGTKDVFVTYPSDKSVIQDASGNVGIGTTSPSAILETSSNSDGSIFASTYVDSGVGGSFIGRKARGSQSSPSGVLSGDTLTSVLGRGYTSAGAFSGNVGAVAIVAAENFSSTANGTNITFATTATGATSRTERMRVTDAGNFGIGTSSPVTRLHVAGTGSGPTLRLENQTASTGKTYEIISGDSGPLRFQDITAGAERMRIASDGNVGIGTNSPTFLLQVNGTGYFNSNVQFFPQDGFRFTSVSAVSAMRFGSAFTGESTAEWAYNRAGAVATLSIGATGSALTEIMRAQSNGNVGIGTSSPVSRLDVNGDLKTGNTVRIGLADANNTIVNIGEGATGNKFAIIDFIADTTYTDYGCRVGRYNNGPNGTSELQHRGTGALSINAFDAGVVLLQTQNTERMRVTSGGDVGIGATAPGTRLQVADVAAPSGFSSTAVRVTRSNYGADFIGYIDQGVGHGGIISTVDNGTPTERMRITNAGNVGIGTSSPISTIGRSLHVFNDANTGTVASNAIAVVQSLNRNGVVDIASSATGTSSLSFSTTPGTIVAGIASNIGEQSLLFRSGGTTERMRIDSSGRVGIGTSAPQQILQVSTVGESIDGPFFSSSTGPWMRFIPNSSPGAYNGIVAAGTNSFIFSGGSANTGTLTIAPWADGSSGVVINASGNVGIGTSSPSSLLHVNGTVNFSGALTSGNLADAVGYKGLPPNAQGSGYTLVLADQGKMVTITGGVTIPANGSVAFPVGTTVVIYNNSASNQTISITTDTLRLAGTATTGARTLAQRGFATCIKVDATEWVVTGNVT